MLSMTSSPSTNHVWKIWSSATTTCCNYTDPVWHRWVKCDTTNSSTATTITTSLTDTVWRIWQTMPQPTHYEWVRDRRQAATEARLQETPEQRADRERIAREATAANVARQLAEKQAREVADKRARQLLISTLTPEQRETYRKFSYFDVEVAGKTYRINHGTHGNVVQVDKDGRPIERYCVQPSDVPTCDAMLAQKLSLEFYPEEFFRKANVTRIRN